MLVARSHAVRARRGCPAALRRATIPFGTFRHYAKPRSRACPPSRSALAARHSAFVEVLHRTPPESGNPAHRNILAGRIIRLHCAQPDATGEVFDLRPGKPAQARPE